LAELIQSFERIKSISDNDDIKKVTDFSFPAVLVIGTEKAGKSSLLEAFTGFHFFPTGLPFVTRSSFLLHQS
jgi:GTP-binding protein EngB required for normal cell division